MPQLAQYYNRYEMLKINGKSFSTPFVDIPVKPTDRYIVYKQSVTRFDVVSDDYYGSPFFNWLILYANAQHGLMEFDIPDGTTIRVPYPLEQSLNDYIQGLNNKLVE